MEERVLSMHEVPGSMPGSSTLIFVFFSVKSVCWCQNIYQSKLEVKGGLSSNGRARACVPGSYTLTFVFFFSEECLLVSKRLP